MNGIGGDNWKDIVIPVKMYFRIILAQFYKFSINNSVHTTNAPVRFWARIYRIYRIYRIHMSFYFEVFLRSIFCQYVRISVYAHMYMHCSLPSLIWSAYAGDRYTYTYTQIFSRAIIFRYSFSSGYPQKTKPCGTRINKQTNKHVTSCWAWLL
jgi:hypothetical protein